jgi:hypothetical protein
MINLNRINNNVKIISVLVLWYFLWQTQQVTVPSSEEIIASCNNIILYQFPEANSTDIFIVYIFTYVIILSCLYAVRQGNVLFKENGKEENALQLSIPTHNNKDISRIGLRELIQYNIIT